MKPMPALVAFVYYEDYVCFSLNIYQADFPKTKLWLRHEVRAEEANEEAQSEVIKLDVWLFYLFRLR